MYVSMMLTAAAVLVPLPRPLALRHLSTSAAAISSAAATAAPPSIALYQYAICPFCAKAKALLSYTGIKPSRIIEVNPLNKSELKELSKDYRKVPIAIIDGKQINGSNEIVDVLLEHPYVESTLQNRWMHATTTSSSSIPDDEAAGAMNMDVFRSSDAATKWSAFANDDLAALMYPNICRTLRDSYQAFGYVGDVPTFSPVQKAMIKGIGSLAMYFAASKIKKKRGIDDEQESLGEAILSFEKDGLGGGSKMFSSGLSQPNLGDISLFGTLRSVEGLPAHDIALSHSDVVKNWYLRMEGEMED
mmetsp:Transcript_11948/g.25870  ORF Transcript_11948/g.25870 Transcript_11948/m.25870 type:complete len:303 (+) Transcript_11948:78-986(+)